MTPRRLVFLVVALLAALVATAPATGSAATPLGSASAAKNARAQLKNCAPLAAAVKKKSGSAKRAAQRKLRDCKAQNQARTIAARQIAGYGLVGARGDGLGVDWRHCANGRWLHYSDHATYGRSRSEGKSWRITHAIVRQGGKWFDAVLSQPLKGGARMEVGIARRGNKWQVAIASFGTNLSSRGDVVRSKAVAKDCVDPN